jgi:hypothetical protein
MENKANRKPAKKFCSGPSGSCQAWPVLLGIKAPAVDKIADLSKKILELV